MDESVFRVLQTKNRKYISDFELLGLNTKPYLVAHDNTEYCTKGCVSAAMGALLHRSQGDEWFTQFV